MQAEWYYAEHRQQLGPITWIELRDLADGGRIGPEDLVWREGLADWVRAATVPGLCAQRLLAAEAVPQASLVEKPAHDLYAREKRRAVRRLVNEDGMSPGIKMILWVGGAVAALIVVGVLLFLLTRVRVGPGEWQVTLAPQQTEERTVTFRGGQTVNITVTTVLGKGKERPVLELAVLPRHGNMPLDVARNPENPSLTFFSPATQSYRVRLINRDQNPVTCTVRHN